MTREEEEYQKRLAIAAAEAEEGFEHDGTYGTKGAWFMLGLGYPPDPVKVAAMEAEYEAWVTAGRPMPPEPTPEERLKATEEAVAQAIAQGIPVPPNLLQIRREEAKRARQALDAAARPAPLEPTR
jgi:hypothetical protein